MTAPYTLAEAAARLHKSKRWLQDWLSRNPVDAAGRPFYSQLGRDKLFRECDIDRILDAAARAVPCRSNSSRRGQARRRTGRSEELTSKSLWIEA